MGTPEPTAPLPLARLAGVGLVVFLANAALLVLQLVAGKLLAPFVGSSLETWTAIIGVFLTGIALGNGLGGRLADRYPTPRTLAVLLALGALAAVWVIVFPMLLNKTGTHKPIPLGPRIPLLAAVLCLPAGFALSLLTPVAIKLGLPDVSKTGRVAGLIFALSTLGCLLGNYVTGFYLIPEFTINTLVLVAAGALAVLAVGALLMRTPGEPLSQPDEPALPPGADVPGPPTVNAHAFGDIRRAYLIVFLASFGGMTLELTASRVLAETLGVSLFTWTGVIGVMLAGTALGNFVGGLVADRVNRPGSGSDPRVVLGGVLVGAACVCVLNLAVRVVLHNLGAFGSYTLRQQVVGWTFSLFFLPMFALGMVSPQVIRLAVPDVAHAGRVAGRVYAWSTAGAIAGTFAAGYVLISTLGWKETVLLVALILIAAGFLAARVWRQDILLYLCAVALGGVTGGFLLMLLPGRDQDTIVVRETNYYTIKVKWYLRPAYDEYGRQVYEDGKEVWVRTSRRSLTLDHLLHSVVDPEDPLYIYYPHEQIQIEFMRGAFTRTARPKVLVIGGGGYTFPRYTMELMPQTEMDVVEIDPGVTRVAREYLGFHDYPGLRVVHMDGRQFVAERAGAGTYDLVTQDAVNDLSVPAHLLTREYNDAVKATLKPDGVYLLTVIDSLSEGRLWRSAMRTLGETFPHVALLSSEPLPPAEPPEDATDEQAANWALRKRAWEVTRSVYLIYASDKPLDMAAVRAEIGRQLHPAFAAGMAAGALAGLAAESGPAGPVLAAVAPESARGNYHWFSYEVPADRLKPLLDRDPGVILTDQYAPVDNLMADVFRNR